MRVWLLVAALAGCYERGSATSREQPQADPAVEATDAAAAALPAAVDPPGTADPDAHLRVRIEAEPGHLDPLIAGDAVALRITLGDVYEGLYGRASATAAPAPSLATGIEVDGARVRVHLRAGVRWHDGAPFTAGDVVFTYRLLSGPKPIASWLAPSLADLREVAARGDGEVELVFARPQPRLEELLADVPILPRHVFEGAGPIERAPANRAPVGTGPLAFRAWKPGESITFMRNRDYWGTPSAAAVITYRIIPNRTRALALIAAGGVDVAPQLPIDEARRAASDEVRIYGYRQPSFLAAVYNARRPALATADARRALTMLLDRPTLARTLLGGYARVASGPYPPDSPMNAADVTPWPFDPGAARALVPEPPSLALLVPAGSRVMGGIADVWASDARQVAHLAVESVPFAEMMARVREGDFDVALMAFTTSRDPDLYNRFHSSQIGGENYGAIADDELDRLLEQARTEVDPAKRTELGRAIHRRLHQLSPMAFIADDVRAGLARADIGGLDPGDGLAARFLWRAK